MNPFFAAIAGVFGIGLIVAGLVGVKWVNEVDFPLTEEERKRITPPAFGERAAYICVGTTLLSFCIIELVRLSKAR